MYFSIEFSTCFCDLWIYYLQAFVQKWRHGILVEILDQSEVGAFSYKIYTKYFFLLNNFQFFSLTTTYAIYIFWCKNADIIFRSKSLTSRTNFTQVIFLFIFLSYRIFHLFLWPLNILSTSFRAKMATWHSDRNFWPVETTGIFVQILHEFFFTFERIFHFFFGPQNMLSASFGAKMSTLYSSQNTWPIGQKAIFVKFYPSFFIYLIFYRIFHLFLWPLNILSISFRAKMEKLHSAQNSWPIGSRSIFVQNLPQLLFLSK